MNVIAARFACQSEPQLGADSRTAKLHAATGPCRERCLLSGVHYNGVYDLDEGAKLIKPGKGSLSKKAWPHNVQGRSL